MDRKFFSQFTKIAAAAVVLFAAYGGASAQQGPPMAYGEQFIQVSDNECLDRAQRALRSEGYSSSNQGNNSVYGTKRNQSAYILCVDDRGNRMRVITIVASRNGGESTERANLARRMERSGGWGGNDGGGAGCGLGRRITEYENGFTGIWTRRGGGVIGNANNRGTYDAIWTRGSERAEAILDIRLVGNRVTVQRNDTGYNGGNSCTYTGTMNGNRITGTISCRTGGTNMRWEATVECN